LGGIFGQNKAVELGGRLHCGNGNVPQDQMKQEEKQPGDKKGTGPEPK